jgi:hypothetical protein
VSDVPLITGTSSLDLLTEAGLSATAPITSTNRPFFWQQLERIRAALVICDSLGGIKHARVTLDNAQIKALPTTPVTLITAPAAGLEIVPILGRVRLDAAGGIYTNINEDYSAIAIYWLGDFSTWALTGIVDDSSGSPRDLFKLSQMLRNTANTSIRLIPYHDYFANGWVSAPVTETTTTEAKALSIAADNNGSGNYTGGHTSNTLRIDLVYMVL